MLNSNGLKSDPWGILCSWHRGLTFPHWLTHCTLPLKTESNLRNDQRIRHTFLHISLLWRCSVCKLYWMWNSNNVIVFSRWIIYSRFSSKSVFLYQCSFLLSLLSQHHSSPQCTHGSVITPLYMFWNFLMVLGLWFYMGTLQSLICICVSLFFCHVLSRVSSNSSFTKRLNWEFIYWGKRIYSPMMLMFHRELSCCLVI